MLVRKNYYYQRREEIRSLVLEILTSVEEMIIHTDEFLLNPSDEIREEILTLEEFVNTYEGKIEKYILEIVSLEQLDTSEIKWIFSMSRIIRELERVGDQIINVLTMSDFLDKKEIQPTIHKFLGYEKSMVNYLYSGIKYDDLEKLEATISHDKYVNQLDKKTMNNIVDALQVRSNLTESQLKIVIISRFLERIGDHIANAAKAHKRSIIFVEKTKE